MSNERLAVSLIVDGSFNNVVISKELLSELSQTLREEGRCAVHLANKTLFAEGLVVLGKGSKNQVMVFPNK